MNETHTNRLFEDFELDCASPIDVPPLKWLDPTLPAEVLTAESWSHFRITC